MSESYTKLHLTHNGKLSDKWESYLSVYDSVMSEYKNKDISLLEIGVQNGGSLEIWKKYFSNAKHIIGCDINNQCNFLTFDQPEIHLIVDDATTTSTRQKISTITNQLDIVIDDGSHNSRDIVLAFAQYFPMIRDDGIYLAEDLHASYWANFDGGINHPLSSINFFKLLVDIVNSEHWGIDPVSSSDLLNKFKNVYGFDISSAELAKIHSVEFRNSMCIIKKRPKNENRLGRRRVRGTQTPVVNIKAFENTLNEPASQHNNSWSKIST